MKCSFTKTILSTALGLILVITTPAWADLKKPEEQSKTAQAVQDDVNNEARKHVEERRKKITADAISAVQKTKDALKLLDEKKLDEALVALENVTGKLELIIARDPKLSLAQVDVGISTYDLIATPATVKFLVNQAENHLENYEVQAARKLLENLVSEIVISTTSIPLATYPEAIKAIAPLIDAGKVDEAKKDLQLVLNTLVVTNKIIPLPVLRAESLLKDAEELSEKKDRTVEDNKKLEELYAEIKVQLELAQLLGYGKKGDFKPIDEELKKIEKKSASGNAGKKWYDKIKEQVSDLF